MYGKYPGAKSSKTKAKKKTMKAGGVKKTPKAKMKAGGKMRKSC